MPTLKETVVTVMDDGTEQTKVSVFRGPVGEY
jgi:hypothetical protein